MRQIPANESIANLQERTTAIAHYASIDVRPYRLNVEVGRAVELMGCIGKTPLPPQLAADFARAALRLVALVQPMAAPSVAPSWAKGEKGYRDALAKLPATA